MSSLYATYSTALAPRKVLSEQGNDWLQLREMLLVHYNHICMNYYDSQIEGAVTEMQKWCHALSHYLTLPLDASFEPRSQEWQNVKQSANALRLKINRLANPTLWKSSDWVALISILGEAYTEHLSKEDQVLKNLGN